MTQPDPLVFVIDDDPSVRVGLNNLLQSAGLSAQLFPSVQDFLKLGRPEGPGCIIMDIRMPGCNGLDSQRDLMAVDIRLPIIFITGFPDIPIAVHAIRNGAVDFLVKPLRDQELLNAIWVALDKDQARCAAERRLAELRGRLATLTGRQRQVLRRVVAGRLNKQIAGELGVSEMTVKIHRSLVMRRMQAANVVELMRMADALGTTEAD